MCRNLIYLICLIILLSGCRKDEVSAKYKDEVSAKYIDNSGGRDFVPFYECMKGPRTIVASECRSLDLDDDGDVDLRDFVIFQRDFHLPFAWDIDISIDEDSSDNKIILN